jgi:EpsI family protein
VIAASLYASQIVDRTPAITAPMQVSLFNAPGWRILSGPENWSAHINADRTQTVTYDKAGERVYVSIGYFTHDRRGREIVNSQNSAADGADWRKIAEQHEVIYHFGESAEMKLDVLAGPDRRRLLAATLYWRGDDIYTDKLAFKWAQMRDKLHRRNPPGGVLIIASDYAGEPAQALARIRAFTSDVETFAKWRARNGGAP